MKAVLAAIPAILLLSVILWSAGQVLTKYFPDHFSIVLGTIFLVIVYVLPRGILGVSQKRSRRV